MMTASMGCFRSWRRRASGAKDGKRLAQAISNLDGGFVFDGLQDGATVRVQVKHLSYLPAPSVEACTILSEAITKHTRVLHYAGSEEGLRSIAARIGSLDDLARSPQDVIVYAEAMRRLTAFTEDPNQWVRAVEGAVPAQVEQTPQEE